jgi:hypothetical protein
MDQNLVNGMSALHARQMWLSFRFNRLPHTRHVLGSSTSAAAPTKSMIFIPQLSDNIPET